MPTLGGSPLILPEYVSTERALLVSVPLVKPAPATSAVYTVAEGYAEVVTLVSATWLTDATAGTRTLDIVVKDAGANIVAFIPPSSTQGPTLQLQYMWMLGFANSTGGTNGNQLGPLPEVVLLPGYTFTVFVNGGGAGDQLSNVVLYVQRYPTDAFQLDGTPAIVPTPLPL